MKDNKKVLHRIKIIAGHIKALEKMIVEDQYCVDIVIQSRAIQKSLKNLDKEIISNHLNSCLIEQIKCGEEDQAIKELLLLFKLN